MKDAPMILGPLDLMGIEGELILIELEHLNDIREAIKGQSDPVLFFVVDGLQFHPDDNFLGWIGDDLGKIVRSIQHERKRQPEFKVTYVIHEIDRMDLDKDKKKRGSLHKFQLSTLTKRLLGKSNVIVTSTKEEYSIREIANRHINLRVCH